MNILQVIPYFAPAWGYGGSLQVAYRLSKEMVKRGHEVTVYTTDTLDADRRVAEAEEVIDGIRVKRFRNLSKALAYRHKIFLSPGMLPTMRTELSSFDIIHMHEYRTIQNVIAHHYARKRGIPYVLQAHGSVTRIMAKQRLKRVYDAIWGYELLKDAARVIALTETEAKQYQAMGISEDKIVIVPNGIDLTEFENLPKKGEFRRKYGLNASQKIILYLGRIHKTKGLDLLAKAFAGLSREMDSARLVMVGPDEGYLSDLTRLVRDLKIEDKVLFTGPIYEKGRLGAYVDADVFVLPSIYETFPITVLELYACGTPVLLTDRCGIADMIDGQAGLVFTDSEDELKNAILRMLSDEKMRQAFAQKGKSLVHEQFNWARIAEQLEHIYCATLLQVRGTSKQK